LSKIKETVGEALFGRSSVRRLGLQRGTTLFVSLRPPLTAHIDSKDLHHTPHTNIDRFWTARAVLGRFWAARAVLGRFWTARAVLDRFWAARAVLGRFRTVVLPISDKNTQTHTNNKPKVAKYGWQCLCFVVESGKHCFQRTVTALGHPGEKDNRSRGESAKRCGLFVVTAAVQVVTACFVVLQSQPNQNYHRSCQKPISKIF
jgi:hypothetical protein